MRLRELRKKTNLTLEELAKIFNTTKSTLSRIENKKIEPSQSQIEDFCNFFGVSADYLLGRSDIPNPEEIKKEPELSEFQFALYEGTKNLTEEQKKAIKTIIDGFNQKGK